MKSLQEIFDSLAVLEDPVTESKQVMFILAFLPESFQTMITALAASTEDVPSLADLKEKLRSEELRQKQAVGTDVDDREGRKALTTTGAGHRRSGPPRKLLTCHFCNKPGHFKRDCRKWAAQKKKDETRTSKHKQSASTADTGTSTSSKAENDSDSESIMVTTHALASVCKGKWIVDSGATCHMCNDREQFADFRPLPETQEVTLGDGYTLNGSGIRTVKIETLLPDGNSQHCMLKNVLYVPKLSYNLLSVSKAAEAGNTARFSRTGCDIVNQKGKVIAFATRAGSLYYLEYCRKERANTSSTANRERLWHRRYGHLGEQNLQRLVNSEMTEQFDYDAKNSIGFCETCVRGKLHRSPFESSRRRASEPLELVHSDVCGKMGDKSQGGAEYFLTFVDDHSPYAWVYPLKSKDQVFERFKQWKALVERSSGKKLRTFRSDNGGEFTSTRLEDYLKEEGIRHERTVPKTPQQNGVAERLNRTLVEMSRSMLLDAKLPQKFWAESVSTAVYLRNRCPTRAVKGKTPYEAWCGEKPKVDHLRVFGCDAYAHVPKDKRGKLDSKARRCVLLGYGETTKGYRLYDPVRARVIHSRDVRFNETERADEQCDTETPTSDHEDTIIIDLSSDSEEANEEPQQLDEPGQVRRSTRERRRPDYYGCPVHLTNLTLAQEPTSYGEAISSPDQSRWRQAMKTEMKSLKDNNVWDLVELPSGRKKVGSKWVYKLKTGADGKVERYKARLVAQGYTQKYGTDYDETFCLVVRQESLRVLLALSVQYGLKLHQIDVTTAFLNGNLEEEVYMAQPEGFTSKGNEHLVCKLRKSIYGLKQSPRCWNTALDAYLKSIGFKQSNSDPCIYYRGTGGDVFYLGVYVDDIVLAAKTDEQLQEVKSALSNQFEIKDMGKLHYFLGMSVLQDEQSKSIWIGQPAYTANLLNKYGMQDCKPVSTPIDPGTRLKTASEAGECVDQHLYQSAVGSLMYLSVSTRPDITYAVSNLARFSVKPTTDHWNAVKRVMRYLRGTTSLGIIFSNRSSELELVGYSDADWGGDISDRKSTSGYLFKVSNGAISWRSKKQTCVALSTAEAEYIALSAAAQESLWLRQLLSELTTTPEISTTIFEDNQSTIAMTRNPQFHGRSKHIEIKYHFIREHVDLGNIKLSYCPSGDMTADMLTKGLNRENFCKHRDRAGLTQQH